MSRRDPIFTFSLCTSLTVHGLALCAVAWWVIEKTPLPKLAALNKDQILVDQMMQPKPLPPAPPPPTIKKPPAPQKAFDPPRQTPRDDSGEADGTGTANRSTAGDTPMQANQGYEQADLMKQAEKFADDAFLPASAGTAEGKNATPQKSPKSGAFSPDMVTQSNSNPDSKTVPNASSSTSKAPGELSAEDTSKPAIAMASGTKIPLPNVPQSQLVTPKTPQKQIVGHKATASDTESVAFAKTNHATFRAGQLMGRNGLRVKMTDPRYGDASVHDFQILGDVPTVVRVTVDVDGNVEDAQIVQPSGSDNIDLDRKLAVYNWNLEPEKGKDGKPADFTWVITIQ